MYKNDNLLKNKLYRKSVNIESDLKYEKKILNNSKVYVKNISRDKFKKDNTSHEFKTIMKQMYSKIDKDTILKPETNYIDFISPTKNENNNNYSKKDKNIAKRRLFPSFSPKNVNFEKRKDKLTVKQLKINGENEDILSPFHDYSNQLMDRFTQISIIRPNRNDIFIEPSSDTENQNDEFVYFYEPKKEMRLELGNSSKKEIKNIFENTFVENKLMLRNEIELSIEGMSDGDKIRYNLKYMDLLKKEELYNNLIVKYDLLLKELNEIKNKNTISSDSGKSEDKRIQHLEDIIIIKNYNSNIRDLKNRRNRAKIKKIKRRKMKSLTPNKKNYSSSEETRTRDNSQNAHASSKSNELIKTKKSISNIMIISKENEFNLTASYTKLITNNNSPSNKTKKKLKRIAKKYKNKNVNKNNKDTNNDINKDNIENNKMLNKDNWNSLNQILNNISFSYASSHERNQKNKKCKKITKVKKRVLKVKEKKEEKHRLASNSTNRKIKKLNIPLIDIKNEILSYNIQKKYIRFKKSVDLKYPKNNIRNNIIFLNNKFIHCHSDSWSLAKTKKPVKKDDIIVKNINLNIIKNDNNNQNNNIIKNNNSINNQNNNIITENKFKSIENNSENKEFSYFSSEIQENSEYYSENEIVKNDVENYNEKKNNEKNKIKKDKKIPLKIKIVKFSKKPKANNPYIDALFQKLVNKLLVKRTFKKWLKISKKK